MDTSSVGSVIAHARKGVRLTQVELADLAGISERTLREIEGGQGNPTLAVILRVCDVLGLSLTVGRASGQPARAKAEGRG